MGDFRGVLDADFDGDGCTKRSCFAELGDRLTLDLTPLSLLSGFLDETTGPELRGFFETVFLLTATAASA